MRRIQQIRQDKVRAPLKYLPPQDPPNIKPPGGGTGNEYWAGLAAYEVRALTGRYAPTGAETFNATVPAAWRSAPDHGDPAKTITAWSGGCQINGDQLVIDGGGHTDSAYNGITVCDFGDRSGSPGGFAYVDGSATDPARVPTTQDHHATYGSDPSAVHTYGGLVAVSATEYMRVGGSMWRQGGFTETAWLRNVSTGGYTRLADCPKSHRWAVVKNGAKSLWLGIQTAEFAFYDHDAGTWPGGRQFLPNASDPMCIDGCAMWDSARGRIVMVGGDRQALYTPDWQANTVAQDGDITWTGDTTVVSQVGLSGFYDAALDRYWVWGGRNTGTDRGYTHLAWFDGADVLTPGAVAVTEVALTGDAIGTVLNTQGSFGRFVWLPTPRVIGFVSSPAHPAYVIQLPRT